VFRENPGLNLSVATPVAMADLIPRSLPNCQFVTAC